MKTMIDALDAFRAENGVTSKGKLAVVVQLTRIASSKSFPLMPDDFRTANKGQVAGLGGAFLNKILAEHGINQTLAREGGRTSRGSMAMMEKYVDLLNSLEDEGCLDIPAIEIYWIQKVKEFFADKPFKFAAVSDRSISAALEDLFDQARKRQQENPGTQYMGTMLQHLVGAKLKIVLPDLPLEMHGADVADAPTGRSGDFVIEDTVIHCTTAPGNPLMQKCKDNLAAGCKPVIITLRERVQMAYQLAADEGLEGRVDVWDIQQFLSTSINERAFFSRSNCDEVICDIVAQYNEIIYEVETDPSLRIEYAVVSL